MSRGALRIAIRADASVHLGLGHVKRCISLGQAAAACGAEVRFVSRFLGVSLDVFRQDPNLEFTDLPKVATHRLSWQTDAEQTVESLVAWRPDWVVVDHYGLDAGWHRHVAEKLQSRICVIDDLADRNIEADVLVDPNLSADHRQKYLGRLDPQTTLFGGPRFALLGPEYSTAARAPLNEIVESVGIFMGGTDSKDLSSIVLRACREHAGFHGEIEIVTTRDNPHVAGLRRLAQSLGNTRLTEDLPDLAAFFARHDLQIGAGGGATWERCAVGAPSIGILAAENQRMVLPLLCALGAIEFFEPSGDDVARELGTVIRNTISNPSRRADLGARARALVDGFGARRVAIHLHARMLSVRDATLEDAEMMLGWRNHPNTRKFSADPREISLEEHLRWFRSVLDDSSRPTYIATAGLADVGVIRFDVAQEVALVSLYLDPTLHGIGLGTRMLAAAEVEVAAKMKISRFEARVLGDNSRSRGLFESSSYRFEGEVARKAAATPHG
jgi:UDP-2,4-diacetamido-2,4,6-trideoxy-beta-L-altropyranose hydrolase